RTILRYKVSIILIALVFLVASSIFAYYKPNIYSSSTSLEIMDENNGGGDSTDFMLKAFGGNTANIDNEIAVIKSRFIIQKALETLNLTTNYYRTNILNKKTEIYKDSPFIVNVDVLEDFAYAKTFELIPRSEDSFSLIIKPVAVYSIKNALAKLNIKQLEDVDKVVYNKVHKYGEEISTAWFTFTIDKINHIDSKHYSFNFVPKEVLFDNYARGLSVSQVSEYASVLSLSFQDNVSLRAKEILNAIAQSYMMQGIDQKTKVAELTLGFIDTQLDSINSRLKNSESNLEDFKMRNDVVDLGGKAALASTKVAEYEAQQLELQTEINILSNVKHFINKNEDLSGLTVGTINFADNTLGSLVSNLQTMTNTKNNLLIDFTELHPEVQKLTKNISSMRRSIKTALKSSLGQLYQRKTDLKRMIKKYSKSLESLPSQEKELARLSRPFNVNQKIYEYLLQKKAETAILKSSTISNARVLDAARDEWMPIKPKRKLIVLVGLILGLIVGIAFAFLREFMIYTVKNADEVEKLTSLPMYGVIPLNKDKITNNVFLEAFRNIRTNLQFLPGESKNQIISITSSVSGEGKTTITAALSEILARGDKKVLMLDLDLRKASLHKMFNLSNNIGMSNYLTLQNTLDEVIKETDIFGLEMITTGPLPPNPSELILTPIFEELLDRLKEKYDYIVIDTPPAGLVTDAVILMNYSDISFAVVRAEYTRKEFVKNIDRIAQDHSNNRMGIILNGTQIGAQYGYGYGASYAYGYGNAQYYQDRK
ncbi:MAG: polysaccharide biosynthesis tyrosine autokinase, partial [Campylobacterota bacterium]|nr:polysaccharide biosynthesis tyrosine autokinase [Campylobacterota bacterium]